MKVLMLTEEQDIFYHILLEALNEIDAVTGHASIETPKQEIQSFDPDIIIHNAKNKSKIYGNCITIAINEMDEDNCFSLHNKDSENFIKPFVKINMDDLDNEKYRSDVVYVGNPSLLPDSIASIHSNADIKFKIIHNQPVPISNYCGSCTFDDYKKFFHMAKCSLLDKGDSGTSIYAYKLLDVIYSGGNPIVYSNDEQYISDIYAALDGKSFRDNFISKEEIFNSHTNYDRMSKIFEKIGLSKMSQKILESKGK